MQSSSDKNESVWISPHLSKQCKRKQPFSCPGEIEVIWSAWRTRFVESFVTCAWKNPREPRWRSSRSASNPSWHRISLRSSSVNPCNLETWKVPSQSSLNRIQSLNNWSEDVRMVETDSTVVQNAAVPGCTMLHHASPSHKLQQVMNFINSTCTTSELQIATFSMWGALLLDAFGTLEKYPTLRQSKSQQSLSPKPHKWNLLFPLQFDLGSKLHAPTAAVRSFTPYWLEKRTTCVKKHDSTRLDWSGHAWVTFHFYWGLDWKIAGGKFNRVQPSLVCISLHFFLD